MSIKPTKKPFKKTSSSSYWPITPIHIWKRQIEYKLRWAKVDRELKKLLKLRLYNNLFIPGVFFGNTQELNLTQVSYGKFPLIELIVLLLIIYLSMRSRK